MKHIGYYLEQIQKAIKNIPKDLDSETNVEKLQLYLQKLNLFQII